MCTQSKILNLFSLVERQLHSDPSNLWVLHIKAHYSTYPEVKTDFTTWKQEDYKEHIHTSYLYKLMNTTTS